MAGAEGTGCSAAGTHGCPWVAAAPASVRPSVRPPLHQLSAARQVGCHLPANFSRLFCRRCYRPQVQLIFYPGSSLPCGTRLSNLRGLRVLKEGGQGGRRAGCSGPIRGAQSWKTTPALESTALHCTSHITLASPAAAGSAGEPAASQPSRCVSHPALLSSLEITVCFLARACWQQGSLVGVSYPSGGSWPDMAGAGRCHPQRFLHLSGAGDLFADGVAANVPNSSVSL